MCRILCAEFCVQRRNFCGLVPLLCFHNLVKKVGMFLKALKDTSLRLCLEVCDITRNQLVHICAHVVNFIIKSHLQAGIPVVSFEQH